jgi:hypothetical protein
MKGCELEKNLLRILIIKPRFNKGLNVSYFSFTLKMEAGLSSETLMHIYKTTGHHIPQDHELVYFVLKKHLKVSIFALLVLTDTNKT